MRKQKKKDLFAIKTSRKPAKRFAILTYLFCYSLSIAPPLYFLYRSHKTIDEIGYKFFPSLLVLNNAEKFYLLAFCILTFVLGLVFFLISQRVNLSKHYKPLDELQAHISKLIRGSFSHNNISTADKAYCYELLKTYNYLYKSLQASLKRDLIFLEELEKGHDPELARVLINEKLEQLGINLQNKNQHTNKEQAA